jgi:4-hydroxybutyryl-CoA dehydratase / vinylacetyl-CoA-Delta-isomerase
MAKYHFASKYHDCVKIVQDMAGGLLSTAPTYKDFNNPEIGPLIDRYLGGKAGIPAEYRLRMLQLIRRILDPEIEVLAVHGEGSFEAQRMTIYAEAMADILQHQKYVEREAGIHRT